MKMIATAALWFLVKVNLGLRYLLRRGQKDVGSGSNPNFISFQRQYLIPHLIALFADWLQAPYLYKLYSHYGFEEEQIAVLYACGLAAAVLLPAVGTPCLAGNVGRKSACIAAAVAYAVASLMNISRNYGILVIGRILSGTAASALFGSFESWYAHEHVETHDFPREWIATTFASASYWSSILSVVAGAVAYGLADFLDWGPVAPFVLAAPFFLGAAAAVGFTWNENYGRPIGAASLTCGKPCMDSLREIGENKRLLLLGVIQSLFESVTYIFVFLWTPVLSADGSPPPLGIVFATFMVCTMIGGTLAELLERRLPSSVVLFGATAGATAAGVVCAVFSHTRTPTPTVSSASACFFAYVVYECCAGAYFGAMGRLRQHAVSPESQSAAVSALTWFRLPMNLIACTLLMLLHDDSFRHGNRLIFTVCSSLLLAATLCVGSYIPLDKSRQTTVVNDHPQI